MFFPFNSPAKIEKGVGMHKSILSMEKQQKAKVFFSSKDDYEFTLNKLYEKLISLQREIHVSKKKVIILFEGADASGKGGAIKRLTSCLDPRGIQVHSIGKPTDDERAENYLERFWKRLPKPGTITIFDRSWYGRVLAERVEKYCSPEAWKRSYNEINNFEKMLIDDDIIILKYFLDLTYDEQAKRFIERKNNPFKAWKLTHEDLRNRKKWNHYYPAFKDMLRLTNTDHCPWTVIAADSKWYARVSIINDVLKRLKKN